jgi:hypothetical protein
MSNVLSLGSLTPVSAPSSAAVAGTALASAASATTIQAATQAAGNPNPTLRLDPALGLVVIEFVSKSGAVTSSIPSQRELTAYQNGTAKLPGAQNTSSV